MTDLYQKLNELDDVCKGRGGVVRAPFGYVGGKYQSVQKILKYLPHTDRWVEVFGGSGIVTINREPSKFEVFNDRYAGVVAFYRCLRDKEKVERLIQRLDLTVHSREEWVWCFETWADCNDDVERAARWFYYWKTSFAQRGDAWARSTNPGSILSPRVKNCLPGIEKLHSRFKNVQVENLDFRRCILDYAHSDTVFYLDPPYLGSGKCYQGTDFLEQDHEDMLDLVHSCDGFFAISGYPNPKYDPYKWDDVITWKINSTIDGKNRGAVTECLWIKDA